jgi:hypothetical protein
MHSCNATVAPADPAQQPLSPLKAIENMYFPLQPGNSWTYRMANGATFTNTVDRHESDGSYRLHSTALSSEVTMYYDGDNYRTDSFQPGNIQIILRDQAAVGDSWEVDFVSNGLRNLFCMEVKELRETMDVEGHTYTDVMLLEGESKLVIETEVMRVDFFTQYYYAKDVGLILTTSSRGDYLPLISYDLSGPALK